MDSLTQVILGAAVGEAVLGKKVGHRAMLWGGFAGFLPDLDVSARFVTDEVSALAIHRGFTHSITFAILFSFFLAWLVNGLYSSGLYQKRRFKISAALSVLGLIGFTINFLPYMVTHKINWSLFIWTFAGMILILVLLYPFYFKVPQQEVKTHWKDWYWLFFWAIITHPILDCFTTYGTQLFLPFSDYRVAFNTISVLDPFYTIPFLICLIIAGLLKRGTAPRQIANWMGIGISSVYMLFCVYHKFQVNEIFEKSFAENNIEYSRYMTSPLLFSNVLWLTIAESDTAYYHAYYSFNDEDEKIAHFNIFPKHHDLINGFENDRTIQTLRWFSDDYYTVLRRKDGQLQLNDVRFGIFGDRLKSETDFVFKFILEEENGSLNMHQSREGRDLNKDTFKPLINRIMGREMQ